LRESLESIQESARKAADLTRQLLAYSGKGRFVVEPFELSALVREMTSLIEVSVSRNCVVRFELAEQLPSVQGDVSQFRQVVMNLVVNASEAIAGRSGVIAVRTGATECDRATLDAAWVRDPLTPGLYVYVEIEDTGCGIAPDVQARVFDPFFTTKFTGRGLGLAAVLGIVRGHHGTIQLQSQPGRGTRFRVLLPAAIRSQADSPAPKRPSSAWRGSGTILVVDDEETVRVLARKALQVLGFTVLTANDGREGVQAFREHGDHLRAVLLDLTMPHMRGDEACREFHKIRTDIPIILSSGYNENEVEASFAGLPLAGFIQKPYSMSDLREKLRSILGKAET
jgi:CheY-like chemotaxis protein